MIGILIVVIAGLVVHYLLPAGQGTDIAGDALYALAAYLVVVALAPRWHPVAVFGVSAAWCVAVELFQLTGLPVAWAEAFPPARLVFGTTFTAADLGLYAVGVAAATAADALASRARHGSGLARGPAGS